jgi:LPXTG-motif cell wall-anchored protein
MKLFATFTLAVIALLAVPAAAHAVGYVAADLISVSGDQQAGGTVAVAFNNGAFENAERVSVAVTGEGAVTIGVIRADTINVERSATRLGALDLTLLLPADATGSYTLTATGLSSQSVGTATITVVAADGSTSLPSTGSGIPMLLVYATAAALMLGVALVLARRRSARKQHK